MTRISPPTDCDFILKKRCNRKLQLRYGDVIRFDSTRPYESIPIDLPTTSVEHRKHAVAVAPCRRVVTLLPHTIPM